MSQIQSLQVGRALAALAVVSHHANLAARDFGAPFVPFLDYGWLGVDFFFVLSGFIIAHSSPGKTVSEYTSARLRRVMIPYLPVGILMAVVYATMPDLSAGEHSWSWLTTLTLAPVGSPALSVAWTLQHELFFYAAFGVMLFAKSLRAGLAIWTISILGAYIAGVEPIPLALINLEFVFGVIAYWTYQRGYRGFSLIAGAVVFTALWMFLGADRELSIFVGAAFASLLVYVAQFERDTDLSVPKLWLFLGSASYSIYLVHGIAISIIARLGPPFLLAAAFVGGTIAGIAYYLLFEQWAISKSPQKKLHEVYRRAKGSRKLSDPQDQTF